MYPECFNGIGKFKDYEYKIKFEDNVKPIVHLALRSKLKKELQNMIDQDIIAPVSDGESEWVNSLVIRDGWQLMHIFYPKDCNTIIK